MIALARTALHGAVMLAVLTLATSIRSFAGEGTHPVDLHEEANRRLDAAIRNRKLKEEDPSAYYAKIDSILTESSATPNLRVRAGDMLDSNGEVRVAGTDFKTYLSYSLGMDRDFRLANLLLSHGADPRFMDDNMASPVESVATDCDPLAMALLRFNGFEPTFTESWVSLPAYTKIREVIASSLGGADPAAECAATRAVISMPLPELASWIRYPTPADDEWLLRLYEDGEMAEIENAPGYPAAAAEARAKGLPVVSKETALIRFQMQGGSQPGKPGEMRVNGNTGAKSSGAADAGARESMAPQPSRGGSADH